MSKGHTKDITTIIAYEKSLIYLRESKASDLANHLSAVQPPK